ncbi:hypothetical protein H2200_010687 [Cladophialophora chaetospira]|uniref:J domain-containing protein n=1 Tax=Cladophialophora chaetospira TaxID=386627 RepID=A0AA38X0K5_9EURO|nr:hypothetical protein H2200_010687 [Cladophialophora chaetospira]
MSRTVPSPQAIKYLRRLCAIESPFATISSRPKPTQKPFRCALSHPYCSRQLSTTAIRFQQAHSQPQTPSPQPTETISPVHQDPYLPNITNYYTLFPSTLPRGPPPSSPFDINLPHLRQEFLQLQSKYHPDKFPSGTTSHQKSLALSSLLNTAYKTLNDPLLRARYLLLENYGVDVTVEDNSTHAGLTDQATLLEVMEAQESLEEATSYEDIEKLMQENVPRILGAEELLGKAFAEEDVESAKRECVRLNYWRSLQGALREWEPGKEVRLVH